MSTNETYMNKQGSKSGFKCIHRFIFFYIYHKEDILYFHTVLSLFYGGCTKCAEIYEDLENRKESLKNYWNFISLNLQDLNRP